MDRKPHKLSVQTQPVRRADGIVTGYVTVASGPAFVSATYTPRGIFLALLDGYPPYASPNLSR